MIHQAFFETADEAGARRRRRRQHRRRGAPAAAPAARLPALQGLRRQRRRPGEQPAVLARRGRASTSGAGRRLLDASTRSDDPGGAGPDGRRHEAHQRSRWSTARRTPRSSMPIRRSSTRTCTSSRRTRRRTRCRGARYAALMALLERRQPALPVRGQRRRRAADRVDAARSDRERRRDRPDRRHPVGHAQLSVQHASTARRRSARSCARRIGWGSPSPIRAKTSRDRTSRASC